MKKISSQLIALLLIFLVGCSPEEVINDTEIPEEQSEGRTFSLTANIPTKDNSNSVTAISTKLSLTEDESKVSLAWENGDEIQLVFVQNEIKTSQPTTVNEISNNGKTAKFQFLLPENIDPSETFDLYGVFGGEGLDSDPTIANLPTNPGEATSLISVEDRKDVMLYFKTSGLSTNNLSINVNFKHLGSLFKISLKNSSSSALENIAEVRLYGINASNTDWAFNNGVGGGKFDLVNESFLSEVGTSGNYINLKTQSTSIASNETAIFWAWYPPHPQKLWPELKLELRDSGGNTLYTTTNSKPSRTKPTTASMTYAFFAAYDGSAFQFTDENWSLPPVIDGSGVLTSWSNATGDIVIPMGVTSIADNVFLNNTNITSVTGSNVVSIGVSAFNGCINVTSYDFPLLETVGKNAFRSNTKLQSIDISKVTSIDEAFNGCIALTSVTAPLLTTVGNYSFYKCSSLISVDLPEVQTIGLGAFWDCTSLTSIKADNLISIGESAFRSTKLTVLNFPKLTTIGNDAFNGCNTLTSVTAPLLTTVGNYSFYKCSSLISVDLPEVQNLGLGAFWDCTSLTSIKADNLISIGESAFRSTKLTVLNFPKLTTVGKSSFQSVNTLTSFTAPNLEVVGESTFHTTSLQTVDFPKVKSIGNYGFYNVTSLTIATLPVVETVGLGAFSAQSTNIPSMSLSEVYLTSANLNSVAADAFIKTMTGLTVYVNSEDKVSLFPGDKQYQVIRATSDY